MLSLAILISFKNVAKCPIYTSFPPPLKRSLIVGVGVLCLRQIYQNHFEIIKSHFTALSPALFYASVCQLLSACFGVHVVAMSFCVKP
jgi:hypothetical protein